VGCEHGYGDFFAVEVPDGLDCQRFCTEGESGRAGRRSVRAVSDLAAPRGEGRKSGEQRSRSRDLVVEDELNNPRTSCSSSHGFSPGTGGKTAKEMVRTTILSSRIMDSHTSSPWRRRLFYCSHRDGTCSVELKTLNGDQTGQC
jgi:hypothetical protein